MVFPGSVALLAVLHHLGRRLAVVSASENCHTVLQVAGLAGHFAVEVDGVAAKTHQLRGKPAPDTYLFAARQLAVAPADAAVVEDAPAGVAAGRAGAFGLVVGVARRASPAELLDHGADLVVGDLDELLAPGAPTPTPAPERAERAEREERP